MQTRIVRVLTYMVLALVIALGVTAVISTLLKLPIPKMDADMVAAVGGIGTLIGTIILASRASWTRRREQITTAQLHAVAMRARLRAARYRIHLVFQQLNRFINGEPEPADFTSMHKLLCEIDVWTISEIIPFVPLRDGAAARLAASAAAIRQAIDHFAAVMDDASMANSEEGVTFAESQAKTLRQAHDDVLAVVIVCNGARSALGLH